MSDKEEILKEINDYVAEQRIEDDLSKVRGYGIDSAGRSISFRMTGLKEIRTDLNSLALKSKQLEDSVESNSRNIGGLTDELARIGSLSENNRTEISRIDGDMGNLRKRLTEDEAKYDNAASQIAETAEIASNALDVSSETRVRMAETEGKVEDFERKLRNVPVQLATLDPSAVAIGQIFQYTGDSTADAQRGGFYFYDGAVFTRIKVDPEYKAGKDIEITDDGTINATFDHSGIEAEIKAVSDDLTAHKTAQATKDKAQDDATKANTDAIATLNGGEQTSGSVKNTVLDYIGKAQHARFKVVQTLPPVKDAESNVLYLVPFEGKEGVYKQYILADGKFVQLDNTEVDLSNYYTKHETDTAISDVADALTAKDTEQDGRISALESKPSPTSQCVPWSGNLDDVPISEREGKIYQNWGDTYTKGFFYEWAKGGGSISVVQVNNPIYGIRIGRYVINEDRGKIRSLVLRNGNAYLAIIWDNEKNLFSEVLNIIKGDNISQMTIVNVDENNGKVHTRYSSYDIIAELYLPIYDDGGNYLLFAQYEDSYVVCNTKNLSLFEYTLCLDSDVVNRNFYLTSSYSWKQVHVDSQFDPSAITADISAEVQRATQAESALSTRIDTKADASTWSANLKTQIDSDHSTLSGLSAKWTDILFSQIDADHTTLGTLSNYLTQAKQTEINNAIAKSHTQNTDTMLNNGTLKVESNKISATLPIVSSGDIEGVGTDNKHHLLSKKMDSAMLRTYNSFEAMVADTQRPQGCWCAIIE